MGAPSGGGLFRPIASAAVGLTKPQGGSGTAASTGAAGANTPAAVGATTAADVAAQPGSILTAPAADPRDAGLAAQAGSNPKGSSILGTKAGILGIGQEGMKKSVLGG